MSDDPEYPSTSRQQQQQHYQHSNHSQQPQINIAEEVLTSIHKRENSRDNQFVENPPVPGTPGDFFGVTLLQEPVVEEVTVIFFIFLYSSLTFLKKDLIPITWQIYDYFDAYTANF